MLTPDLPLQPHTHITTTTKADHKTAVVSRDSVAQRGEDPTEHGGLVGRIVALLCLTLPWCPMVPHMCPDHSACTRVSPEINNEPSFMTMYDVVQQQLQTYPISRRQWR